MFASIVCHEYLTAVILTLYILSHIMSNNCVLVFK